METEALTESPLSDSSVDNIRLRADDERLWGELQGHGATDDQVIAQNPT